MVIGAVKCLAIAVISINVLGTSGQVLVKEEAVIEKQIKGEQKVVLELKEAVENNLNQSEDMEWMTSQKNVLEVEYNEGHVIVNLHPDVIAYGGGTHTEYMLGALIMEAVFENSEATTVTILVDGKSNVFPEGSEYVECTRSHYEAYYQMPK